MQACDGAMKSLRSPIRSVAENFSDISFSFFFSKFANSIRDSNPPYSSSFFFVFRVPEAAEFRYRERERRKLKRGKGKKSWFRGGEFARNVKGESDYCMWNYNLWRSWDIKLRYFLPNQWGVIFLLKKKSQKTFACLVLWSAA